MTEEEFSALSREDKMNLIRYLIADMAARLLSDDTETVEKAQHELGSLAMIFMNMHHMIASNAANNRAIIEEIYKEYRT